MTCASFDLNALYVTFASFDLFALYAVYCVTALFDLFVNLVPSAIRVAVWRPRGRHADSTGNEVGHKEQITVDNRQEHKGTLVQMSENIYVPYICLKENKKIYSVNGDLGEEIYNSFLTQNV